MNPSINTMKNYINERIDIAVCDDQFQVHLHEQRYEKALGLILKSDVLLEIGTGLGVFSERIAPLTATYRGIEYDSVTCNAAKLRVANPDWISQGDAQALQFESRSFDVVVCLEVLEHLPDYRKALDEIIRVLKPGGRLIASIPYVRNGSPSKVNPHHLYEPGEIEFKTELAQRFGSVRMNYQRYRESGYETLARTLRLRKFLGLSRQYAQISAGAPEQMRRVLLDDVRSGMLLGLFAIAIKNS